MVYLIKAEVFDFSILHSTTKWTVASVSSLIEELKAICTNRTVTQSKWIDVSASKLALVEAQCYWSVFISTRNALLGQTGDWIDIQTLGILLLCQCYPNVRARADSFHRSEIMAQSLATPAISPPSGTHQQNRHTNGWNSLINLSKLIRDNGLVTQFLCDNVNILVGIISLHLVADEDFQVTREEITRLEVLLMDENGASITDVILDGRPSVQSSDLCALLAANIGWNTQLFPALDISSKSEQATHHLCEMSSEYIVNQSKSTVILHEPGTSTLTNVYIVNCSDSTVYVGSPVSNVCIMGCIDCEIVVMATSGTVVVSYSDKVIVRTVASSLRLENSTDCQAFVYTTRGIILAGDTRGILLAPFNVVYSQHGSDLARIGLHPDSSHATLWCQPLCATLSDSPYALLAPNKLRLVSFPEFNRTSPNELVVCLPQVYTDALEEKRRAIERMKEEFQTVTDPLNIPKLNAIISGHFREWLSVNNRTRTISDILRVHNNQ